MEKIKLTNFEKISPVIVRLTFSNNYKIEIRLGIAGKTGVLNNFEYSAEQFEEIKNKLETDKAEDIILKKLKARKRSENELRTELQHNNISENIINLLIDKYKKFKFINDTDYAQSYMHDKIRFGNKPKSIIISELKNKNINEEIINNAISKLQTESDENDIDMDTCLKLIKKKNRKYLGVKDNIETKNKLIKYLLSKGFKYSTIEKCINKFYISD